MSDFGSARENFNRALEYPQVLQCQLGQSNGLMFLSKLAHTQGDTDTAIEYAQQSFLIAQERELNSYRASVETWLKELDSSLQ